MHEDHNKKEEVLEEELAYDDFVESSEEEDIPKSDHEGEDAFSEIFEDDNPNTSSEDSEKMEQALLELDKQYKRLQADFSNFRKRTESEKSQLSTFVKSEIVTQLLPIVDNFERAIDSAKGGDNESFVEGFAMIYKNLMDTLQRLGVHEIKALGEEFDPNYHQAVLNGPDKNYDDNVVCQVLQKGYEIDKKVIRPAMVKVTQN